MAPLELRLLQCRTLTGNPTLEVETISQRGGMTTRSGHTSFVAENTSSTWPPYVIGGPLYFCPVISIYLLLSSFFSSPNLNRPQIGSLPYFYTWRGPSANLECRSEMCCTGLAANTGRKKVAKNRHLGTIAQLCWAISLQLRHVSTIRKKPVKQQYLLYMSTQYGELRPTSG